MLFETKFFQETLGPEQVKQSVTSWISRTHCAWHWDTKPKARFMRQIVLHFQKVSQEIQTEKPRKGPVSKKCSMSKTNGPT